ncbi:hypothetical protein KAH81_00050 [bacterium]|nr:hypothetical protein [bacterium]
MNHKSGISLLDVIILILIVGVIAALIVPKMKKNEIEEAEKECHARMETLNSAMVDFFSTYGDTSLLHASDEPAEPETTEVAEEDAKDNENEEETVEKAKVRLFTNDIELLKPFLPEDFIAKCPIDGKEYIIHARDSIFYSISCPSGHGQVIKGQFTWEEE